MCQKFRQRHRLLIKIADIALQIHLALQLCQLFPQFTYLRSDPVCLLRLHCIPELLFLFCRLRLQLFQSGANPVIIEHKLRRREYRNALQLLDRPLAQHIKASDRLHFISPKLDPVRIFLREIKDVDDTAPDGKLPGILYLIAFFIAKGHQLLCYRPLIQCTAACDIYHIRLSVPEHQR